MKSIRAFLIASLLPLALAPTGLLAAEPVPMPGHGDYHAHPAALTNAQKQFLASYENVRAALSADDLSAAKSAAAAIAVSQPAAQLAKAASLNAARVAFKKLSEHAAELARDEDGYYIATCPMAEADWVQTTTKISNPYLGQAMPTCGMIKN